ncbi:OadG family protein [Zooshikella harenae]|uniref:Probable oxaloacetate decarboxylase gamma chain n=1 Tax=Zooshikella harenae TaxID=2827238 RepID=A0ABS5ZBJ4_9GAMM|nr:OadG family transporter subunit [Zooshikella harenae]MBU2711429.1 OadG family protein [Zooshikella harenae]
MTPAELMTEGLYLMLLGMGFVFVFLTLLIYATELMSAVVQKYFPEKLIPAKLAKIGPVPAEAEDTQLIAVISAAIQQYRKKHTDRD